MRRAPWATIVLVGLAAAPAAAREIRYDRDVRPILAEFCWRCHGPVEADRRGGLRLDDRTAATGPTESGRAAIVPGRPAESGLVARVATADPDLRMPPPETGKELSPRQVAALEEWIAGGAAFDSHWAFRPLERPAVPRPRAEGVAANAVDRFVFARLEAEGLPIPALAAPGPLFRRLALTLGGLPPAPEAIRGFTRAPGAEAWRAVIDEALASTAYGEHMARRWMDVVRYADSAGYELDYLFAHSHRYRDWLIRAFRDGLPLDRFLAAQLAGDELDPDDPVGRDAVLFLAVGPRRFEGGIQRAAAREQEWLTDVVDTVGSGFLGLTLGCARCHDHKYDAVTQRDYFGLQAVFAGARLDERRIGEKGGDTRPTDLAVAARERPAVVHVLRRGEVDDPLDEAPPLVPGILRTQGVEGPVFEAGGRRETLARWLVSAGRPLVARTLANRIWQWHFGTGLTRTPNDLGVQGEFPSHPELLDWLACELVESGWSLRHLHRLILSSHTFRAAADATAGVREADPENRLLARFPRRRLEAEELRDALLAVSGRLDERAFGPPVVPRVEPWVLSALRNTNSEVTDDPAAARHDPRLEARIAAYELACRMQASAPEAVDLARETKATRDAYGPDFGVQCLVARRLVERGVRCVQIYHVGPDPADDWDTHGGNHDGQTRRMREIDRGCASLLADLKARGMLDETLVVWAGEFGRTPTTEGNNGRDHSPYGYSLWLAGGGVKGGMVHGGTDDFGFRAVDRPVHLHDLNATILRLFGIDHERLSWRHSGRDFRLTDVFGRVVEPILA